MRKLLLAFILSGFVFAPLARIARAQTTPFLTDEEIRMLSNEISGDRAFEHIRWLSHWHRDSGMEGFFKAADYVMKAAKENGLEEVRFVEQPLQGPNYTARVGELWVVEPVAVKLADIGEHAVFLADGSRDADVTAELVYIGDGDPAALKNLDVKGKIVLTSGPPGAAVENAVRAKGALGVVTYQPSEDKSILDAPDQIAWSRIDVNTPAGGRDTFAFVLPPRRGETLRRVLEMDDAEEDFFATGKVVRGGRVVVRAKVDTEVGTAPGRTGFVEAVIRGTRPGVEQIVLTAHLQEEQGSANDDGSGCANLLELARVFNKLIREGKVKRPTRDLRFWWTDEIYSEYRYFQDKPEEAKKILANVHQDMTGANQALGSRVQHLIFAPHSRTSYLDALFESVGTYLIHTNNGYLAASRQGGLPRPHTRPLYATRGTRQGYNARFVPYFDSSDHMVFVEGAIGVPAIALINWDDPFIHSSEDDLDKIDQTQLRRNNFLIGAMAFFLAYADEGDVPTLLAETYAQGSRRLANDLQVAMRILVESKGEADRGWKRASTVMEQGVEREARALDSIRVFAGGNQNALETIQEMRQVLIKAQFGNGELANFYRRLHGTPAPAVALSEAERAASRKVPANAASLDAYFANRNRVPGAARGRLHGLMRDEVYNFVDGRRSYYDIYKAVYAESQAGGTWYYGTVTLEDVVRLLDASVEAKALTLR
ncbi:MAG: M28 family metallopeptidase [Acidobacteriota bacterium]|nr:M28 family metallopeptidase [Acidobacteriota bacterium]